jgi:hypothetical protein
VSELEVGSKAFVIAMAFLCVSQQGPQGGRGVQKHHTTQNTKHKTFWEK